MASSSLGLRAIPLFLKGDWSEYVHALALKGWNSEAPCPMCFVEKGNLYDTEEISDAGLSFPRKTGRTYDAACRACELPRVFSNDQLGTLRENLCFERGKKGIMGLGLQCDIDTLNLARRDRLEPTSQMPDHGAINDMVGPVSLLFWRRSSETSVRRRCPIMCSELHLGPENLGIDWLHSVALGVCGFWIAEILWDCVEANVYGLQHLRSDRVELTFARISEEFGAWIKVELAAGRHHTKPQRFEHKMFGTSSSRKSGLHGAESLSFTAFLSVYVERHGAILADRRQTHTNAGKALLAIIDIIRSHPRQVPQGQRARFCTAVAMLSDAFRALNVAGRPKEHLLADMGGRLRTHGSPGLVACWEDESRNFALKRICIGAHRNVWHARVLMTWLARSEHLPATAQTKRRRG